MRGSVSSKKSLDPRDLREFRLEYKQTRINVHSDRDLKEETVEFLEDTYNELERYCQREPLFLVSYDPVKIDGNAPKVVKIMAHAGEAASVGPMAAVAGMFAEQVGSFLLEKGATEVIAENGGDVFLKISEERVVGVYAGNSKFSRRIGFRVKPDETPLAVCTSSSSVGHSISLGDSDAVSVVAKSCPLADAAATSIGNQVKGSNGIERGLRKAREIKGIYGVLILRGDELGSWGKLPELVEL
jgi:ApbE superfamily uncharacterized protein (UPF0280 family)